MSIRIRRLHVRDVGPLRDFTLEPGDLLGFRLERTRTTEYLSIAAMYDFAVKARILAERAAKRKKKGIK